MESVTETAGQARTEGETPPVLSAGKTARYASGYFGSGAFFALNNFLLPLYLGPLQASNLLIGFLSGTRSFEGAILQPLVGARSDRMWTPLGRRRPFIVVCVPLCALFMALTPFLVQLAPRAHVWFPGIDLVRLRLGLVAAAIVLFTMIFNVMYDPFVALLADITPPKQRGTVNGIAQALGGLGQVAILVVAIPILLGNDHALDAKMTPLFFVAAGLLVVFFIPTVLGVREPRHLPGASLRQHYRWRDYLAVLRADRQIQLYFAVQFFLWFGINAITPYLTLFATKEAGFSASGAIFLAFILLLVTAAFVSPSGWLADRLGLRRVFLIGMILMAGASVAGIFFTNQYILYAVLAIAGVGNAMQTATSYPLLTRLVFPDQMGLYVGLNSTITSLVAPGATLLAGYIFDTFGYTAMFPLVATAFLLSLVPLAALRVERSVYARSQAALAKGETGEG